MKRTDYGYADLTKKEVYDFRKALNLSQAKLSKKIRIKSKNVVSLRVWHTKNASICAYGTTTFAKWRW